MIRANLRIEAAEFSTLRRLLYNRFLSEATTPS